MALGSPKMQPTLKLVTTQVKSRLGDYKFPRTSCPSGSDKIVS